MAGSERRAWWSPAQHELCALTHAGSLKVSPPDTSILTTLNLYRSQVYYGAGPIPGFDNPILVSLNIIYYAYDLLTDFKNEGFTLIYETHWSDEEKKTMLIARTHNILRPAYDAEACVFENGWDSIRALGLSTLRGQRFNWKACGASS